jgi:Sel1 repeat
LALRHALECGLVLAALAADAGAAAADTVRDGQRAYVHRHFEEARRIWTPLAEAGDAEAQVSLGLLFDLGQGVPEDPATAYKWYRRAAEAGLAKAQFNVAVMEDSGVVGPRNPVAAARWYAKAAAHGHLRAQYNLAQLYSSGDGVPRDIAEAKAWYRVAAHGGLTAAADKLAEIERDAPPGPTLAEAMPAVPPVLTADVPTDIAKDVKPGEQPGAEQQAQVNQQVPLTELNEVLEAPWPKLDELFGATESIAEGRTETELLSRENERLAGELEQVNGRVAELESWSKRAEAQIAHLTNANDVAAQNTARLDEDLAGARRQNADLEARLTRADSAREAAEASVEKIRSEMQQVIERSRAEAERLNGELAAAKGQVGEAFTAADEAERARQRAVNKAQQVRGQAERASAELVAARKEIERLHAANDELERQIASLDADSKAAMRSARQTLMEEKQLSAALAGAGLTETPPAPAPKLNSAAIADERSAATAAPTGRVQADPQKPGATGGADQRADISGQAPTTAPAQDDSSGLERFDANVRYLNIRAFETTGAYLFSSIEPVGDGVVHVTTTLAWDTIPPAGQRSYLDSLFDLWTGAQDGAGPTVVRIVDAKGRVLLEKSGTGQDTHRG